MAKKTWRKAEREGDGEERRRLQNCKGVEARKARRTERKTWAKQAKARGKKPEVRNKERADERWLEEPAQEAEWKAERRRRRTKRALLFAVFPLCSRQTPGTAVTFPTHFPLMPMCPPEIHLWRMKRLIVAWFLRRTNSSLPACWGQRASTSHLSFCQREVNCKDS